MLSEDQQTEQRLLQHILLWEEVLNSRNRVFVEDKEGIRTEAFYPSKLEDPSLIIYAPVRVLGKKTIVTNGDQTDTVYDLMSTGKDI